LAIRGSIDYDSIPILELFEVYSSSSVYNEHENSFKREELLLH
jgi:hypothetical protein